MYNMRNPCFCLSLFIHFFYLYPSLASLTTISTDQSLSGNLTLLSEGGVFELGFFRSGSDPASNNCYIGIWYKKVSQQTIVWVANRDDPVSDINTAELTISGGNLVLFDESHKLVWSTNLTVSAPRSGSLVAVLLDNGNLILSDKPDALSESEALWQSFDHPTDTFLPGGKLKLDKKTNKPQYLTSWKSGTDPSTGLYSLELDPNGTNAYFIFWNKTESYWTSGPWNGHTFSMVPEMRLNYIFNFSFVSNENESYFTYSLYNTSIISRFLINFSGQIQQQIWMESTLQWNTFWSQPRRQCQVYASCGAFGICSGYSFCSCLNGFEPKFLSEGIVDSVFSGCMRKTKLQCASSHFSNGEKDGFQEIQNIGLPSHAQTVVVRNAGECESICFSDCSCTAYAYNSNKCSIWHGDLLTVQQLSSDDSSGETLYLKLATSEFNDSPLQKKGSSKRLSLILGITLAGVAVVSCAIIFGYVWKRKIARREAKESIQRNHGRLYDTDLHVKGLLDVRALEEKHNEGMNSIEVPYFEFETLLVATDNFSDANKLGRGGYGPVYKGKLQGGEVIAVKRLSKVSSQGLREFKNEIVLIAKLQHRNLVKLKGCCIKGDEKILIYEYMPNKSLDSILFDRTRSVLLDWQMRFDIILGVARGLLYLHQDSRLRVIHRDLKTSNILLDEEMKPKISDFGLARIFSGKETEGNTERVVGTYGYMSPEYALDGLFSIKSDIFSFGVVLLEIISGKKNTGFYQSEGVSSLLGYAWRLWTENSLLDLMELSLSETCVVNQFTRFAHIGLLCVQDDPSDRPSMSNVMTMLDSETVVLPSPKQPTFFARKALHTQVLSSKPPTTLQFDSSYREGR